VKSHNLIRIAAAAAVTLVIVLFAGTWRTSRPVQAQNNWNNEDSLVKIGFQIAPVPLNLQGKDRELVGLGSYLVNAAGDCNGCHTGGGPPNFNYAAGGNPYFGQPTKVDPTTYLEGGSDFGPAVPPIPGVYPPAAYGDYVGPDIIARNLTPDKTGRPEGGHTLAEFKQILKTGIDFDKLHPTCTSAAPVPTPANCIPPPVDGALLQVMPWPTFHNMTDHYVEAIYEYLSAIPCLESSPDPSNVLHNDCGDPKTGKSTTPPDARRKKKGSSNGL
jgi:hypothetical protein